MMLEIIYIFLPAAVLIAGIAVFIFIIGQSVFNAAYSGLKPKTIVFKALAALAIWFAVSFGMLFVINVTLVSRLVGCENEIPSTLSLMEFLFFVGLLIYVLIGIRLGVWVKGRTKWRTSVRLK